MTKIAIIGSREIKTAMRDYTVRVVERAIELKWEIFTGDADGVDLIVAETCWQQSYAFTMYGTGEEPNNLTPEAEGIRLLAEYVKVKSTGYMPRDVALVNHADRVLAIWNGDSKGTKLIVDYARDMGKVVNLVNPAKLKGKANVS